MTQEELKKLIQELRDNTVLQITFTSEEVTEDGTGYSASETGEVG